MSRKILKVLISILFLIVAAVAVILGIKNFFPELFEQVKYGVKHIVGEPARKTPAFKKDKQEQEIRVTPNYREGKKYGVAPVRRPPQDMTDKYGVSPVQRAKLLKKAKEMREQNVSKYGVAPVRRTPGKYGVAPVNQLRLEEVTVESKYGVEPIKDVGPFVDDLENSEDIGNIK